jgi:hypothetical protein
MNLKDVLKEKKPAIVKKWFETVVGTYHEDARGPLRRVKAQFTNPVGFNIAEGLDGLFDAVLQGLIPDTVSTFLDAIIRIRAIQEFPPSEALAFVFEVKNIIREELGPDLLAERRIAEELAALDRVVDDMALFAFDIYMRCREKIYDLKAQEARDANFRLLQRAKVIAENEK